MAAELPKHRECDPRREPRTSMFVMATLYADAGSLAIKVRDLSPSGALIEGIALPPTGTSVRLCRGSLTAAGDIVWLRGVRAGVSFRSAIQPAEWLPGRRAIAPQQRVDEIVQQFKAASTTEQPTLNSHELLCSSRLNPLELTRLCVGLESLAEDLAADPHLVQRHSEKLQFLDLVSQALRRLAAER